MFGGLVRKVVMGESVSDTRTILRFYAIETLKSMEPFLKKPILYDGTHPID